MMLMKAYTYALQERKLDNGPEITIGVELNTIMRSFPKRFYNRINYELSKLYASNWKPYSRLIIGGDNAGWVLDWEIREIGDVARGLGIRVVNPRWRDISVNQAAFFPNMFFMLNDDWLSIRHRIAFPYYHGMPGTSVEVFDKVYLALCQNHARISRIQVTHSEMQTVALRTGIDPNKVFLIPIGINLGFFPLRDKEAKMRARQRLGIPQSAFVIGSFQKDGNGWGEGLEPKLIKGPDVFLSVVKKLKAHIPELRILLSGPARGYVKAGLESISVPYSHFYLESYPQIGQLFQALDVYLVTSRQEGGPKAILESMASGVPIISTRVGQAMDLIRHGRNGWLADVEDVKTMADLALNVYGLPESVINPIVNNGRATAEENSYSAQIPLWKKFMDGFVE